MAVMQRVVVLGRGGSGKSRFSRELSLITGLPVVELDQHFWRVGSVPRGTEWVAAQSALVAGDRWILDGDLGPYDIVAPRLRAADTVVVLDLSLIRCAWRAWRRGREGRHFWVWLLLWRYRSRPHLMREIDIYAPGANRYVLRRQRAIDRLLSEIRDRHRRALP